jgi:uncharacterized membrane protein
MAGMQRLLRNLFAGWWRMRRSFDAALLDDLAAAIAAGERGHLGELRFAVESRLGIGAVLGGMDATARARQVFAQLQVWDTELNSGVLIYLLLAEHRIEIVVDRGVARCVPQAQWDAVRDTMRQYYARGQWREGSLQGIAAAHALLQTGFPAGNTSQVDELPDRPILL